jgi:CO/xanthine dehydrogenase Mo-binding subunit
MVEPRVDGRSKATGRARYAADAVPRPHLFGAVLTASVPHASVRVEAAAALAVPGVVAVLGPDDDPGVRYSTDPHGGREDSSVFTAEARFVGDVVGAVAATSRDALAAGVAAVVVVEERLSAVVDLDAARALGAAPTDTRFPSNLVHEVELGSGRAEVEAALAAAPHRFEHTFEVAPVPHGFLEPVAAAAEWRGRRCHIWSTTQCPYPVRDRLTAILGVGPDDVVLEPVFVGGGFGGKEEVALEPAAALLSKACGGRPVLVELDRAQCTGRFRSRHGGRIRVRSGVDADGRFLARHVEVDLDAGAYDGHSSTVISNAASIGVILYPGGVIRSEGRCWSTNRTPAGAFRGYGGPQPLFSLESHVDEIARALGIDAVELRRRNCLRAGDADPVQGWTVESFSLDACLDAGEAASGWTTAPPASSGRYRRGRGVAAFVNVSGASVAGHLDAAEAACRIDAGTGRITVETSAVELGQGSFSVFAAIAAETMGVDARLVTVEQRSTADGPYDPGVYGSRGSYVTGTAVALAARALLDELRLLLGGAIRFDGDLVVAGERRLPLAEVGPMRATGAFSAPDNALVAGAQFVDVTVDTATGVVVVDRVVSVHDVGRVLDPMLARGQVEGGVAQGIGYALHEALRHDVDGVPVDRGFLHHLIPTTVGSAAVEAVFVTPRVNPHAPTGAKGLGEPPILGVAPAIANAIRDATGVRLLSLPMTPERVLTALASPTEPSTRSTTRPLEAVT